MTLSPTLEKMKSAHKLLGEYTYELKPAERGYANRTLYINLDDNTFAEKLVTQQMKDIFTGGRGFGLPYEALQKVRLLGHLVRQELQGYETIQLGVLGLVDDAHPATPELLEDAIVGDRLADHDAATVGPAGCTDIKG
jgi:hypothetical protein